MPRFGSLLKSHESTTSCALTSRLTGGANMAPLASLKVHTLPSGLSQLSARTGSVFIVPSDWSEYSTRPSNSWWLMFQPWDS